MVLVGVIETVVVAVTDPGLWDAALVLAGEVPRVGASGQWRFRVGICSTSLSIRVQRLTVRAATPCHDANACCVGRDWEAELFTATVVRMAGVTADDGLGFFAVNSDAVQSVALLHLLDDPLAVAGDLVHFNDGIQTPIRDEKLVGVDNK